MSEFNIKVPEINAMLKELNEKERQNVADLIESDLKSGKIKEMVEEDNETKGNHSTTSEDSLELRIKELEEELATANHCWKECSDRLDWLEDRIAPENAGKSFVIELCDDYRDRFFEIEEDTVYISANGRSRAAKTARIKKMKVGEDFEGNK